MVRKTFDFSTCAAEITVEWVGRWQRQCLGQIPEQLMEVPHDREYRKHLFCGLRSLSPALPTEGELGDLLSSSKAVIHGTASKALLPEACMDAAAKVRSQMGTGLSCVFTDREVGRG